MFEATIRNLERNIRTKKEWIDKKGYGQLTEETLKEAQESITESEAVIKKLTDAPAIPQQPHGEICSWEWIKNDVGGFYHTTCGERIQSLLEIDGFKFCLFCGRKLSPVR